ncbi:Hypothetical predicted protein, partial [Marmota monax]
TTATFKLMRSLFSVLTPSLGSSSVQSSALEPPQLPLHNRYQVLREGAHKQLRSGRRKRRQRKESSIFH